ncbi:MAG TPA: amidohydrolase family protein [Polyangiaceae bacterium]|nr:amidohydrolase family protein [Polyangiaceae bacterium]
MKKSDPERAPEAPISFLPVSNGEFEPPPATERDRRAEARYWRVVEEKARRLGMTRRQFTESAAGMVTALLVMNEVYGCGESPGGGAGGQGGFTRDAGFDVERDVSAADAAYADSQAGYDVHPDATEDVARADSTVSGDEFIFDVQVHNTVPAPPWNASTCGGANATDTMLCPKAFLNEIFVLSDTDVACLSGFPAARQNDQPSIRARGRIKEIIDQLSGSPRLVIHANVRPSDGAAELDAMAEDAANFPVVAWKTYPEPQGLDTDAVGRPFIERARQVGVKIIASHRGIGSDGGAWTGMNSPRDVVTAAKANPDFKFLVYHSAWQSGVREDHPFNMASDAPLGIDRLIKAVLDNGLGPGSNVYAELGSTWHNLRNDMAQAAHALGKLLRYLGPERILWGTDCVLNGNPQSQIEAFRAFQIPPAMQTMYGYPELTPEVKRKILGENAAAVYGVDIAAMRRRITADDINGIILARADDPGAFPRGPRPYGPRTRREFLAFLRWSGGAA